MCRVTTLSELMYVATYNKDVYIKIAYCESFSLVLHRV